MELEFMSELVIWSQAAEGAAVDPYDLPRGIQVKLADASYPGRVIVGALWRKFLRKLVGGKRGLQPVGVFNGVVVFDRPELHGGGLTDGQDMLRALHALGIAPCKRLFEFCSGPGYVGYSLLAYGFCHTLALADLNSAAVEAARATANFNGLQHRVSIYASDGLADIPPDERWDVVVGIPPCTEGTPPPGEIRYHDSDYSIHRRFYADVRHHMRPGGRIVIRESIGEADPRIFEPMIRAGGGRLVTIQTASTLRGERMGLYYVVSEW